MPSSPFSTTESRRQFGLFVVGLSWVIGLMVAWPGSLIGDEWVHYHQIARFRSGDFTVMVEWLTTIPGYHWAVSVLLYAFDATSPTAARCVNAAFGLAALAAFHALRREVHPDDATRTTMQFAVLPVLFPFFFLIYTDVLSLALILAATFATAKRGHLWAALILTCAIGVRQNNVLWSGFLAAWTVWTGWRAAGGEGAWRWRGIVHSASAYVIPVGVFVGYWIWNGSVSYSGSQSAMHPDASLHAGNPFFALFMLALLLPLQVATGLVAFARRAAARPAWWLWPVLVFAVFATCFEIDHPYNRIALSVNVRNAWLMTVKDEPWAWWLFGLLATGAATALSALPLARCRCLVFVPFALLYLATSWLIEPRYSLIPLGLYLALRKPAADRLEAATTALWGILAVYLAIGIFGFRLMI